MDNERDRPPGAGRSGSDTAAATQGPTLILVVAQLAASSTYNLGDSEVLGTEELRVR